MERDFLQPACNREIAPSQEGVEILEQIDRRLHLVDHLVEGLQGVFGGGVPVLLGLDGSASGDDPRAVTPLVRLFLPARCNLQDQIPNPDLFTRDDIEQWIPRTDQRLNFLGDQHES